MALSAVYYVYSNELMEGTSTTTFEPDAKMTRAMFWTVLARIDGKEITGTNWWITARNWAMEHGISDGTNPHANITRQEMVTMLWRFAGTPSTTGTLIGYLDKDKVASWAETAMRWAVGNDIINGVTAVTLDPNGQATRAQCAQIFLNAKIGE